MSKSTQKQFTYVFENGHYKLKYIDTNTDMNRVKSQILPSSAPNVQTINEEDKIPNLKLDFMLKSSVQDDTCNLNKTVQYFPKHFTSRKANIKNLDSDSSSVRKQSKDEFDITQNKVDEFAINTPKKQSPEKLTPQKKLKELEDQIRQLKSQIVEKQNANNYLKNQQTSISKQRNNFQQKYNNVLAINKQLSEKLKLLSKGGQNLSKQENSLKQNYEQQFNEIAKKVQAYSYEQKTLLRCNNKLLYQNEKVREQIQKITIENEKLKIQNKQLKQFEKKQIYYQQKINKLQKQVDIILSRKKIQINQIKSSYQQQIQQYQNTVGNLNAQLNKLNKINLNIQKQKQTIKNIEINYQKKIEQLQKQLNFLQTNENRKIQQNKNKIEKKEIDLKNYFSDELIRLKNQNDSLKQLQCQYENKLMNYQSQYKQFHDYHESVIIQFQSKFSQYQNQIERLYTIIQALQNQKQSKYIELENNYLEQLNDLNNQIKKQKQIINTCSKNFKKKDQEDNPNLQIELRQALENKQKQNNQLNEQIYEIQIDYTNLKSEFYSYEIRTKNQMLNLKGAHQRQIQELISSNQKLKNNEQLLIRKLKRLTQQNNEKDKILQKFINKKMTSSQTEKKKYQNEQQLQQISIYQKQNQYLNNLLHEKDTKITQLQQIIQGKTSFDKQKVIYMNAQKTNLIKLQAKFQIRKSMIRSSDSHLKSFVNDINSYYIDVIGNLNQLI